MAFNTSAGFTPDQTNDSGIPLFGTSPYNTPTGLNWQNAFLDTLQSARYSLLAGVLSGGVCTVAGLIVTVPANTVYLAGGMPWANAAAETQAVTDDDVTYIWGCSDGLLRVTDSLTQDPDFLGNLSCLLTKATAVTGVVTLDNTVQQRARAANHTTRVLTDGPLSLDYAANTVALGASGTASATAGAATLNTQRGTITSEALTTAAGADYVLTLTNSKISASSIVLVSVDNGSNTTEGVAVNRVTPGSGSVVIRIRNTHASAALNGTLKVNFVVL